MNRIRFGGSGPLFLRTLAQSQPRARPPGEQGRLTPGAGGAQPLVPAHPSAEVQAMSAGQPIYQEFPPRPALTAFVHCLWTFTGPPDDAPQHIAPDGRPELIVHCGDPYLERHGSGDVVQAPVLFAGQITQPLTLVARSGAAVIGVRFHAYAARAFLGIEADSATDKRLDLAALHGDDAAKLGSHARQQANCLSALTLVEDYVEAHLARARLDEHIRDAVETLIVGGEPKRPGHISERQWQRRFKADVGVSPRLLQTILRFRRVFDAIESPATRGWVEAALAAGYFDQPQMARDFRRFLGCTARDWAAQRAGLAKALTEPAAAPDGYKRRDSGAG